MVHPDHFLLLQNGYHQVSLFNLQDIKEDVVVAGISSPSSNGNIHSPPIEQVRDVCLNLCGRFRGKMTLLEFCLKT